MLRYIIKLFFCLLLFLTIGHHLAANDKLPPNSIWPTTFYVGADVAKTCVGLKKKTGLAYEINSSIDFSRILLDVDYGLGKIQRDATKHKGFFSSVNGKYFRVGLGYNFLTPTPDRNQFFIGFRYARSFFDFQLKGDKLQCNHPLDEACSNDSKPSEGCTKAPIALRNRQDKAIAYWWEVITGGKVALIGILSIGCTARYKFSKQIEDSLSVWPFDIPGFGLAEFDYAFGYSLYVSLGIPLQKSKNAWHEDSR